MKKFSILQSVYKNDIPEYLQQSLQSIKDNSIQPETIVLVKDGKLPESLETVIKEWKEKLPMNVVGYEENKGLAFALNYGMRFCETGFIARMDSDDICFPNRFEEQIKYFEIHPNSTICGTNLMEFYEKNGQIAEKIRIFPEYTDMNSKTLYKGTPIGHPSVMIKTSVLKSFKYNNNILMNEDIDLWFRLIKGGYQIENIQKPLVHFRITDKTFQRRSIKKAVNEFQIYFSNLYSLFGFSLSLSFPIFRFLSRFLPFRINKRLYFSEF